MSEDTALVSEDTQNTVLVFEDTALVAIPFRVCKLAKNDPNFSVRRIKASFSEAGQFPFGFASWRKGDPNVSVRRIEASFRKRCNSLSGLQVGEKAIQTFLCGGSRLPFGSGAIPFRETLGVHRECTRSAQGVHRECTRSAPEVHQE